MSKDLARRLSSLDATMLVAGGIMGSGIFLVPGLVAAEVGAPGLALLVWLVCGILALCGALCYAELSAAIPETGGTYPFLKRAYRHPILPFLYAWSMLLVVYSGAIAAVATAFAIHACDPTPLSGGSSHGISATRWSTASRTPGSPSS